MGPRSLWLLLVALHLVRIAHVCCQYTEDYELTFLVAIKNSGSGLEIVIHTRFPENCDSEGRLELDPKTFFIPGHNLSSECGDQYFRCQHLLVETQNASGDFNIIFVPLENGVLLLSYWFDLNNMAMENSSFIVNSYNCSPTVFYKIDSIIYVVCVSSYSKYFAVYEVNLTLNGSVIEYATLIGPSSNMTISDSSSSSSLSNFILINHTVYFAIGNIIAVMDILSPTDTQSYPEIQDCSQIDKLAIANLCACDGCQQFLSAYCTDRYVCYDPIYRDWTSMLLFSRDGKPYLCPNNNYRATLFINSALQFSVGDSSSFTINGIKNSSGICFESQSTTYFAYSDQQHNNIYVYDFITQSNHYIAPYDCPAHQDCPQLFLLENQYLVIRDANHNLVLDTHANFSLIVNISSSIADILAVLHSNAYSAITPSPPNIHSTTTAKVPPAPGMNCHSRLPLALQMHVTVHK